MNNQTIQTFKEKGFNLKRVFKPIKNGIKTLENNYYVCYKNRAILTIRENENNTFNTLEHFNFPTGELFKHNPNIPLERALQIAEKAAEKIK